MEEKFLKARQEREEERLSRAKEVSEVAAQRQQFEDQAAALEKAAEAKLHSSDLDGAQAAVAELRALLLDASNSVSLTGHDMARANGTLARLQQSLDEARRTAPAPSGAELPDVASATGGKRFKFSKKVKTAKVPGEGSAEAEGDPSAARTATSAAGSHGATYGPAEGATVYVPHSAAAFVRDCVGCKVLIVPIAGSVFVSHCRDCSIYVCCHQLRMKDCRDVKVFVWCASTPIIEQCAGMLFGSYEKWTGLLQSKVGSGGGATTYPTHAEWVSKLGDIGDVARTRLSYENVDDFQWVRKTASPHWRVMTEEEAQEEPTPFVQDA